MTYTTLPELLKEAARLYGTRPAVSMLESYRTHTYTYSELYEQAQKTALLLRTHGVKKGDCVVMCAPNSPQAVVALWGVLLRGALFVPLTTQSTPEQTRSIVGETGARILFSHSRARPLHIEGVKEINLDLLDELLTDIDPTTFVLPQSTPTDTAQIMFTSGTTGSPKGVVLSHENMLTTALAVRARIPLSEHDRILSILPLSHIYEQVVGLLAPMSAGAHVIYLHRPSALVTLLQEHRITKMAAVPEFLHLLMEKIEHGATEAGKEASLRRLFDLSPHTPRFVRRFLARSILHKLGGALDIVASGGAPLSPELEHKWNALGVHLYQGYGLTEVAGVATMNAPGMHKPGTVGTAIPGVELTLGEEKEILLRGASVFSGYYKNEEATRAALDESGHYHTGDIGEIDADGFLSIKGRKKYLILGPGGQNVYPEDIEQMIAQVSGIESAVIGVDEEGRTLICAVLRTRKKHVDAEKVIAEANEKLASYQAVHRVFVWPEYDFPRSSSRKVKRDLVREWVERELSGDESESSVAASHSRLVMLLAAVSGEKPERITDESALGSTLGMDSLMRVEIVSRIELEYGVLVDETKIATETTVAELEKLIEESAPASTALPFISWPLSLWAHVLRNVLVQPLLYLLARIFARLTVHGKENLQGLKGPCLFMPNHVTIADSIYIGKALPYRFRRKQAHAAGADIDLFTKYGRFIWLWRLALNVFALPRKEGYQIEQGLMYVGWMLDHKYSVVIFPEGHTNDGEHLLPLKDGAGLIATTMGVPVVPVHIEGIEHVVKPRTTKIIGMGKDVSVTFGTPFYFKRTDSIEHALGEIEHALQELHNKANEKTS